MTLDRPNWVDLKKHHFFFGKIPKRHGKAEIMSDVTKLPKWAQEKMQRLEMQRKEAVQALNQFLDEQTESGITVSEYPLTGEGPGPQKKTRYVQGRILEILHHGVRLRVALVDKGNVHNNAIELHWEAESGYHTVAFVPTSHQAAELVSKENMR